MIMRTITETFLKRLEAQRDEAQTLKLEKVASALDGQIKKHADAVRGDGDDYFYPYDQMVADLEGYIWAGAMRVQDFYGKVVDAQKLHESIEAAAADLINSIRHKSGSIVGAYEQSVPGECQERTAIEVEEEDG
jgi:hypothetical protein